MGVCDIAEKCFNCEKFMNNNGECIGDRNGCPEYIDKEKKNE